MYTRFRVDSGCAATEGFVSATYPSSAGFQPARHGGQESRRYGRHGSTHCWPATCQGPAWLGTISALTLAKALTIVLTAREIRASPAARPSCTDRPEGDVPTVDTADEVPIEGTTTGDLDPEHFGDYFEKQYGQPLDRALEKDAISLGQLLNNVRLARGATPNLAGLLMFGRRPQRHRPAFVVKAVSFVGDDPAGDKYRDSEDILGCLRDLHKGTMSFLARNLRRLQGTKGINTEGDLEVPPAALEELVVNMWLHRDYFISAPWRVMMYDNRIELISPGSLPNNLTVENIRNGVSVIRNPLIASFATKELPYRGIGTGIRRALAAVPTIGLTSSDELNLFTATIPRPPQRR